MKTIRDVMKKDVSYVNPNSTLVEAAQVMQKLNVASVPVCDQGGVIGIVTDRDIVIRNIAHGKNPQQSVVREVMTTGVVTVTPDTNVNEATKIMSTQQVRRLPVVENNNLIGFVALSDIATGDPFTFEASEALSEISKCDKPAYKGIQHTK